MNPKGLWALQTNSFHSTAIYKNDNSQGLLFFKVRIQQLPKEFYSTQYLPQDQEAFSDHLFFQYHVLENVSFCILFTLEFNYAHRFLWNGSLKCLCALQPTSARATSLQKKN